MESPGSTIFSRPAGEVDELDGWRAEALSSFVAPTMIGKELAHYRITAKLGEGGMGVIYRAHDTHLDRSAVIKVLRADAAHDSDWRRRFVQEAKAASTLNHPNIVTIYDIDSDDGLDFIAMELVVGTSLLEQIPERGLPLSLVLDYAVQMTDAVAAAHAIGIVHRDLKPGNVMVTASGQIKILDFGLAKVMPLSPRDEGDASAPTAVRTQAGLVLGSLAYMSPEQAGGKEVAPSSDVFALGLVLYEMLTGQRPFERDSALATLHAVQADPAPPLRKLRADVPPELGRIVRNCLEKAPSDRYPSARELHRDLVRLKDEVLGSRVSLSSLLRRKIVLASVVALAAAGTWWWTRLSGERWARDEALPEIENLVLAERYVDAFRLASSAERYLDSDDRLASLFDRFSMPFRIETSPAGARVFYRPYLGPSEEWELVGETPIEGARLPFASLRFRIEKEGFEPYEGSFADVEPVVRVTLDPSGERPPSMVRVPGGKRRIDELDVDVPDFYLDALEVSNRQYQEFVDAGGYRERRYWEHPFRGESRDLGFEEAMARFVDATGRPGPATWELGRFHEGTGSLPVGV
jgi:serine/threonine protein kinase